MELSKQRCLQNREDLKGQKLNNQRTERNDQRTKLHFQQRDTIKLSWDSNKLAKSNDRRKKFSDQRIKRNAESKANIMRVNAAQGWPSFNI